MKFFNQHRKMKKIACMLIVASLLAASAVGCSKGADESSVATQASQQLEAYTVNLGYYNCDHMVPACVGEAAGIFKELGLDVKISGNGKVPQAMAAGQMDVGYIGTRGLMAARPKGSPIMVAATNHIGGSMYLVVSNDIEKPEDLLGQPVAIGSDPLKSESWVCGYAQDTGLPSDPSNYECLSFGSDADKYLALKSGNIKAYTCCDPWGSMAEYEGTGKIMSTYMEMDGAMGVCCAFAMNGNFEKEHPELARKMVLAHTKSIEYIYTHPVKAAKIFADYYNVPEEVAMMTIYKKTVAEGRTLTWKIDDAQYAHAMEGYEKYDLVDELPEYEDVVKKNMLAESGAKDFDEFIKNDVDEVYPVGMSYDDWKAKAMELDA